MQLHPQMKAILDQAAASGAKPFHDMTPVEARKAIETMFSAFRGEPAPFGKIENRAIPGADGNIDVRIYTPAGAGPFGALVYFHGGGWVIGDLDSWDTLCRSLSADSGCVVVSVDYRLAPEHKFPAGPEDCYAATSWVAKNAAALGIDPKRIGVGGDSAGGNLAAVVSQMARDRGGPAIKFQLLIYPATDAGLDTPSQREFAEDGYVLSRKDMEWFWGHYLRDPKDVENPQVSPARASSLKGLPPALVILAAIDPLRDEGESYAARLQQDGVPTECRLYEGVTHGFVSMAAMLDEGKKAVADMCDRLGAALGK